MTLEFKGPSTYRMNLEVDPIFGVAALTVRQSNISFVIVMKSLIDGKFQKHLGPVMWYIDVYGICSCSTLISIHFSNNKNSSISL